MAVALGGRTFCARHHQPHNVPVCDPSQTVNIIHNNVYITWHWQSWALGVVCTLFKKYSFLQTHFDKKRALLWSRWANIFRGELHTDSDKEAVKAKSDEENNMLDVESRCWTPTTGIYYFPLWVYDFCDDFYNWTTNIILLKLRYMTISIGQACA